MERMVETNFKSLDLVVYVPGTWHLICLAGVDVHSE